jgi:hypothetical protein
MYSKPRVLIVSGVIPASDRGGGCLALHRHFIERDDFEVMVTGSSLYNCTCDNTIQLSHSRVAHRLRRTCLARLVSNIEFFINWCRLPTGLEQAARDWNPDIIFTVPDNIHSGWASRLAAGLGVPLVTNYQDLFPLSRFIHLNNKPYDWVSRWLMRRFHQLHDRSELVFYTSEGMRDWFGGHANGHVLYPIGDEVNVNVPVRHDAADETVLVYAGNCYGAYGRMLLRLANSLIDSSSIKLRIYAAGNDWHDDDVKRFRDAGIYRGFIPFEKLKAELDAADAYLTVMSFEPEEKPFVETSFTTKWLDYAPCAKPVFVWAPLYSSAATFALEHKCGVVVDVDDDKQVVSAVKATMSNPDAVCQVSEASTVVANGCLSAGAIHRRLKENLDSIAPCKFTL